MPRMGKAKGKGKGRGTSRRNAVSPDSGNAAKHLQSQKARGGSLKHLQYIQENEAKLRDASTENLTTLIQETNAHFVNNVNDHRDARPDAVVLVKETDIGVHIAKKLATASSSLKLESLKAELKQGQYASGGSIDWKALGNDCGVYWRSAPSVTVFKGALNLKRKKRAAQRQRQRDDLGQEVRPDKKLKKKATEESKSGEKRQLKLKRHLLHLMADAPTVTLSDGPGKPPQQQKRLPFFETLIDPNSFSKTVEDLFYSSFLVKDGFATVDVDLETDLPVLAPIAVAARTGDGNQGDDAETTHQQVFSIDMDMWLKARRAFKVKEAAIPMVVSGAPQDLEVAKDVGQYPYDPKSMKPHFINQMRPSSQEGAQEGAGAGAGSGAGAGAGARAGVGRRAAVVPDSDSDDDDIEML